MADPDGDDEFPNDFHGLDFDNIPGLQAPNPPAQLPISSMSNVAASPAGSPAPSTGSDGFDEMDPTFLAAIDEIEARAIGGMSRGSESSVRVDPGPSELVCNHPAVHQTKYTSPHRTHFFEGTEAKGGIEQPHNSVSSSDKLSTKKQGKRKADTLDEADVRVILEGYETELTCPICCDILYANGVPGSLSNGGLMPDLFSVGAQVANPCGHACCGECGYGWLARNKYAPSCATCRSSLHAEKPLLPNYALDNLVRQHLQSLAITGRPEWQKKGYKFIEWTKRLDSWKKQTATRAAEDKAQEVARQRRRRRLRIHEVNDHAHVNPWLADGHEYEESEDGMVILRTRWSRGRH